MPFSDFRLCKYQDTISTDPITNDSIQQTKACLIQEYDCHLTSCMTSGF